MLSIKFTRADEIDAKAAQFDRDNPRIWQFFVAAAFDRINRGYKHYSINACYEIARWSMDTTSRGVNEFKLSNNYRQWYARKFHTMYPEYSDFFFTRTRPSENQPPLHRKEKGPEDYPYNNQLDSLLQ